MIFFSISCDNNEESSLVKTETLHRLTNEDILTASNLIKIKDGKMRSKKYTITSKSNLESAPEEPYLEYIDLIDEVDLRIEIDSRTEHILDQTYEQNIEYLSQLNLFNNQELAAVTAFKDELINTKDFNSSILHFENAIALIPMTNKKLQRFYNFIDGLKVMNTYDPDFFIQGNYTSKSTGLFGSCLSASIGVGIAFVGLATIEVGSFGVATGVTVAGFIWASAEWGAACKGSSGKKLYPPEIKISSRKSDIFITLDENGDLVESPILLSFEPKVIFPF